MMGADIVQLIREDDALFALRVVMRRPGVTIAEIDESIDHLRGVVASRQSEVVPTSRAADRPDALR